MLFNESKIILGPAIDALKKSSFVISVFGSENGCYGVF